MKGAQEFLNVRLHARGHRPGCDQRIKQMSDDQLMAYGRSAAWMAARNNGETWRVQREEARCRVAARHRSTAHYRVTFELMVGAAMGA